MQRERKKYEDLTITDDFMCREDPTIRLNDGTEKVFLNTKGTKKENTSLNDAEKDLRKLLKYFESKVPQDDYTRELEEAVTAAKEHREWRREYMKWEWMVQRIRREERTEGELTKLVSQVYRKAVKGKTPEAIAEDLEEELSEVKRIYDVVVKYLPDYEPEKILEELWNKR